MGWQAEAAPDYGTSRGAARGGGVRIGSWSCENAVAWRSDRMDHLFDCEFRCEDRYARWISVDLGKTILVAPELAGFSWGNSGIEPYSGPGNQLSKNR